jgi:hypothetical protein
MRSVLRRCPVWDTFLRRRHDGRRCHDCHDETPRDVTPSPGAAVVEHLPRNLAGFSVGGMQGGAVVGFSMCS